MLRLSVPIVGRCLISRCLLRRRLFFITLSLCLPLVIYIYLAAGPFFRTDHSGSYFSQDYGNSVVNSSCVHPRLELWNENIRALFQPPAPLTCSTVEENWVYVTNGTFHISANAVKRHGSVTCNYIPIRRGNDDFQVLLGDAIRAMADGSKVTSDVFQVTCKAADGERYKNVHSTIAVTEKVLDRSAKTLSRLPSSSLNLNILMFGFDSVSRMTWMRNLPKSYKYIADVLGAVVLKGYNVVGDGTPQALLPILTGKTEMELPEARRGFSGAKSVDGHPWIWKDLQEVGYVTQWAEESPQIGTFTYRMLGFRDQPVDHYMRTYFLAAEPKYSHHEPFCVGSIPRHKNMMRTMRDFVDAYPSRLRFSFVFHSEYSHDSNNKLQWADDDLLELLQYLNDNGHLDKSLLVLMSDHGARFQNVRATEQGKYEERLPFVAVRVPPWFADRYPEAAGNLRANAERLTTPFDLHETFHDVIDFKRQRLDSRSDGGTSRRFRRGFSLFEAIPEERSCADADVEPHWCSCLAWRKVPDSMTEVRLAAEEVIATINNITSSHAAVCSRLMLDNITSAVRYSARTEVLRFRKSSDVHGRHADLTDDMEATEAFYQVTFVAQPSGALYEATVRHVLPASSSADDVGKFTVDTRDISRINRYGSQPHCIASQLPHLRPYCYCTKQLN